MQSKIQNPKSKILTLDVGLKRIGLAVCDPLWLAARPLAVIERRSRNEDFVKLANVVKQEEIGQMLCGLPLNMDGTEGERAQSTRKWAMRLAQAMRALLGVPIPVVLWDERLSTYEAKAILHQQQEYPRRGVMHPAQSFGNEKGKPMRDDAAAAAVILQSYLDAHKAGEALDLGRIELTPYSPLYDT